MKKAAKKAARGAGFQVVVPPTHGKMGHSIVVPSSRTRCGHEIVSPSSTNKR